MKRLLWTFAAVGLGASLVAAAFQQPKPSPDTPKPAAEPGAADETKPADEAKPMTTKLATFGGGCFWCTEAVYQEVDGVKLVVSGYAGGQYPNPTYEQVSTGQTGHAEVVQLTYDPEVVTYPELLEIFWKTHDPTTPNAQGPDHGTQYRSIILYHDEEQKKEAEYYGKKLNESGAFRAPIVTQLEPYTVFYPAEKYHQDYFRRNPRASYCRFYIVPKMQKFRKAFRDKLAPKE